MSRPGHIDNQLIRSLRRGSPRRGGNTAPLLPAPPVSCPSHSLTLNVDRHGGKYAITCSKESKKCWRKEDKKLRITTLIRKAIQGPFDTFKPVEGILKGVERYTGIIGIPVSFAREMDKEVRLSEEKKQFENVLFMIHRGVLTVLTAIALIANCMMAQNKFSSLSDDMNSGLALLAATSNFLKYRRFENVFKSVTMDASKEVARSKKVTIRERSSLFLALEPIKGKPLDKSKMFGGQIP